MIPSMRPSKLRASRLDPVLWRLRREPSLALEDGALLLALVLVLVLLLLLRSLVVVLAVTGATVLDDDVVVVDETASVAIDVVVEEAAEVWDEAVDVGIPMMEMFDVTEEEG